MSDDRVKTDSYGQCPKCGDYTNTEYWGEEDGYTIFGCCNCEITFDVLDNSDEYSYKNRDDHADWYYVQNIMTFKEHWSGSAPHGICD